MTFESNICDHFQMTCFKMELAITITGKQHDNLKINNNNNELHITVVSDRLCAHEVKCHPQSLLQSLLPP